MIRELRELIIPLALSIVSAVILLTVRIVLFKLLYQWGKRTKNGMPEVIGSTLKVPSLFWCMAMGLQVGVNFANLPDRTLIFISKVIYVMIVLSITIATANLLHKIFKNYLQRLEIPIPATTLIEVILKVSVYITGFLTVLTLLGISITPLITALGIGGLAVALALRDTLANFFAGIHILLEKSIRVGDFIKIETGDEGYVEDLTWRTTRIRTLQNNTVVIPNGKLAQSIVTNYSLPERRTAIRLNLSVSYSCDPELVEKVVLDEVKRAVGEVPGLLGDPKPIVRFIPGFGENSLDFTLICQVEDFAEQYRVQSELRKRIFKRFRQEGIEIPFPHRIVYLRKEKDLRPQGR